MNKNDIYCLNMFLKRHNCYDEFLEAIKKKYTDVDQRNLLLDFYLTNSYINIISMVSPWSHTKNGFDFWVIRYRLYDEFLNKLSANENKLRYIRK